MTLTPLFGALTPLGRARRALSPFAAAITAYYKADEASGALVDVFGNNLAAVNGPTSAAGKVGTSRALASASNQYFIGPDSAASSMAGVSFGVAAWVYVVSFTGDSAIIAKESSGANREWRLDMNASNDARFIIFASGGTAIATHPGPFALNTWYRVWGWFDQGASTAYIQVDNGPIYSAAVSGAISDTTSNLGVGRYGGSSAFWNGRVDEVLIVRNYVPTSADRAADYNGGAGRAYEDIT